MEHEDLIEFLTSSPTSGHAVSCAAALLEEAGFERATEARIWEEPLPASFFVIREPGSLVAVRRGALPPMEGGFGIACAHTDFPGLRLRSNPVRSLHGHSMLSAEIYGSPILSTWFDRDLGIAGTALARSSDGSLSRRLFRIPGSTARISMPAIHLNRGMNEEGFTFNKEEHLPALASVSGLTNDDLAGAIAAACALPAGELAGWTAHLVDTQPPAIGGFRGEFIHAQGLDDLAMCHAGLRALIASSSPGRTAVLCLLDAEEVGSETESGALSRFLDTVLENLAGDRRSYGLALLRSILVSIDGAHGLNPAWESKYERGNRPVMNSGPVIKSNAQARYATGALSEAYFRACAAAAGSPVQSYAGRNDIPCGSTVGPKIASRLGIPAVDAGNPILSMHSIRECTGTGDHGRMSGILEEHFAGRHACLAGGVR